MVAEEQPPTHKKTRIISVVAATAIALACGTNYAYSAWAPQFADKLQLSATQSNVVVCHPTYLLNTNVVLQ
ncbi:hypothetical protein J4E85_008315 [Alternaria conjuncta]|uniref:uncharacterized protein n=1 Tax=Alternaria conjuncta TaxID=181017 RepID=UPI00221E8FA5|nr:uncharacterized protein J4E85_008315 [Alternaria conjuncta]KAI4924155.1 hypothetical protein J4E85_008315 [Alternaria conjuncta]